jgi:hypothetical protein
VLDGVGSITNSILYITSCVLDLAAKAISVALNIICCVLYIALSVISKVLSSALSITDCTLSAACCIINCALGFAAQAVALPLCLAGGVLGCNTSSRWRAEEVILAKCRKCKHTACLNKCCSLQQCIAR